MLFTTPADDLSAVPAKFHSGTIVWASSRTRQTRLPYDPSFFATSRITQKRILVYSSIAGELKTSGNSRTEIDEPPCRNVHRPLRTFLKTAFRFAFMTSSSDLKPFAN